MRSGRPIPALARVFEPEREPKRRGDDLRAIHNYFGYKALGTLRRRGLCSGAIYRTEAFLRMEQEDRSGARKNQTVHIEHTIPIHSLAWAIHEELPQYADGDWESALAWIIQHSVTTAFTKHQQTVGILHGYAKRSDVFDMDSPFFLKPFARYTPIFDQGEKIYNVFTETAVERSTGFDDHTETVEQLQVLAR
jgi:hypothetical protein